MEIRYPLKISGRLGTAWYPSRLEHVSIYPADHLAYCGEDVERLATELSVTTLHEMIHICSMQCGHRTVELPWPAFSFLDYFIKGLVRFELPPGHPPLSGWRTFEGDTAHRQSNKMDSTADKNEKS